MCAQEVDLLALEKAESLARGGALKWASVVFCQPDQLSRLGFYRRREAQRNDSIQSRLKSAVRSYLDGVEQGLVQLRTSLAEIHIIQKSLSEAHAVLGGSQATLSNFEPLRQLAMAHVQLSAVTQSLPCLSTVADMAYQTHLLIERRCLLEAHAKLRDFEILRDDVLYRLHRAATLPHGVQGPLSSDPHGVGAEGAVSAAQLGVEAWVQELFAGVQDLSGELGRVVFSLAGSPISVALSDPTLLVSAVRVVEREEYLDAEESRGPLQKLWKPPGRPKHWRDGFFRALERGVRERLLPSGLDEDQVTPAGLVRHLTQLQERLLAEMQAVCSVLTPCVPPHYEISRSVASICHQAVAGHLREILSLELAHPALYCVLRWILVVFPSEEIMGHPDLSLEVDFSELGPLVPPELMEEQLSRYARAVRGCLSQWMHKALEVEYSDWFRDQEPDKDQEGFYLSSLPQLLMQMLVENVRLASALGPCVESRVRIVAVQEMENCLLWLREALVKYSAEHTKDKLAPAFYIPYLLAILNGCVLLSSSVSCLQPESPVCPGARRAAPCLRSALDKTQKKTCRLYLDELQTEMQPLFEQIPSRPWLFGSDIALKVCEKVESFSQHLSGVRPPLCQKSMAVFCCVEGSLFVRI
ncbi:exocyst complex component 3-like protein isoform X2 [Spea bombifrons]|uniref:exocyst complex component 3-like protein isoform X2 n=1 Tax=Spea bombifrons TaxID=233779 RepID=UPI002349BD1B|nr:exocyst complex component 3-like protein isoform X2 [Spea bombifrons]